VFEEVGLFDPTYQNNAEDLDLAKRITAFGYKIGIAVDAFVHHYGGITRLSYEQEEK
jgi:GT2 family glycosyltransferase